MRFSINNKLSFIGSNNLNKDDFKYFSQEFDNNVIDLVKHKWLYPCEYLHDLEKFNKALPSKKQFRSSSTGKKT